jgi:DDE superfamily endonuclease
MSDPGSRSASCYGRSSMLPPVPGAYGMALPAANRPSCGRRRRNSATCFARIILLAADGSHVQFHFTPTRASWLNQVEIWFSILQGKSLQGASFHSVAQLRKHVEAYNENVKPFVWTKTEVRQRVKGRRVSQLLIPGTTPSRSWPHAVANRAASAACPTRRLGLRQIAFSRAITTINCARRV